MDAPHVRIVSMNAVVLPERIVVMGEVVNEDTIPAFVNVNATLVDGTGKTIAEESSFDKISHILLPKQVSPYRIDFPNVSLQEVKNVRMDAKATLVPTSADPVIGVMNQKSNRWRGPQCSARNPAESERADSEHPARDCNFLRQQRESRSGSPTVMWIARCFPNCRNLLRLRFRARSWEKFRTIMWSSTTTALPGLNPSRGAGPRSLLLSPRALVACALRRALGLRAAGRSDGGPAHYYFHFGYFHFWQWRSYVLSDGAGPHLEKTVRLGQEIPVDIEVRCRRQVSGDFVLHEWLRERVFFVHAGPDTSLSFLVHPSRVPVKHPNAISGVAFPYDKFEILFSPR